MRRGALSRATLAGFAALSLVGAISCGGRREGTANVSNSTYTTAANANIVAQPTATPATASQDTALRNTVQANLTKYGVTGVTVEVADGEVTLRGNIARAKLQDAMKAANEAGPKKVNNQMNIQ